AKHLQGGLIVNVVAAAEGFDERFVFSKMGEHPQLDLRIVGGYEQVTRFGDKSSTDFTPELGFDGNVLEIRIAAAQPSGRRDRLIETRMDAAGCRIDEQRER